MQGGMTMDLLTATQRINSILEQLENNTGHIVSGISLKDVDITTFGDKTTNYQRTVNIDLMPIPGTKWAK